MGQQSSLQINQHNTISIDLLPDEIQAKIMSNLCVIELIKIVNILSKKYNSMVSKDTIIWKQLCIKKLEISTYKNYDSQEYDAMNSYIGIDGYSFKDPPDYFLSYLKLIPLYVDSIGITPGFKPWCQYIAHQKAMTFFQKLFMNYLSIYSVKKMRFWSVANDINERHIEEQVNVIDQTQLFGEILKICKPTILDTQCAIVPSIIPEECANYIKILHVGDDRQKHYTFNTLCEVLKYLNKLETVYIGELCYIPTQQKITLIPWPDTLINMYWKRNPTKSDQQLMIFFEKDVRSKCPKLKVFDKI